MRTRRPSDRGKDRLLGYKSVDDACAPFRRASFSAFGLFCGDGLVSGRVGDVSLHAVG
jgi:hypothetical protein